MFNVYTTPPGTPPHCERCGDMPRMLQRPDDKEEVIGKRLEVFEAQTKPLIKHYEAAGLLRSWTPTPMSKPFSRASSARYSAGP